MTTTKEFNDKLVRVWVSTAAGGLARWEWTDGNSFDTTFGGVAADGNYVTTINPVAAGVASIPITTVRAGAVPLTNTNLATQHVVDANVLLAVAAGGADPSTVLRTYIQSVSSSGAVVSFIAQQADNFPFTVGTAAPGAATLTLDPDDTFPITYSGLGWGPMSKARTGLEISFIPVNSSGVPVDPNGTTVAVTVRRHVSRGSINRETKVPSTPVGVTSSATTAAHPIGQPFKIDANGGRYGFTLGAIAGGPPPALARIEAWVREINQ